MNYDDFVLYKYIKNRTYFYIGPFFSNLIIYR